MEWPRKGQTTVASRLNGWLLLLFPEVFGEEGNKGEDLHAT